MIDKKDLRLGNLVSIPNHGVAIITEIKESTVSAILPDDKFSWPYKYDCLMPIELNDEWLDKSKFHWDQVTWSQEYVMLAPIKKGFQVYYGTLTYGKCSIIIDYVHTLQNFMFAVTGKELTIKEPINGNK